MTVTNPQRTALRLHVRKVKPTPVPAPAARPVVEVKTVVNRTVTVAYMTPTARAKSPSV